MSNEEKCSVVVVVVVFFLLFFVLFDEMVCSLYSEHISPYRDFIGMKLHRQIYLFHEMLNCRGYRPLLVCILCPDHNTLIIYHITILK